ncbi:MAG: hypothetical protein AAF847_16010 [Bacteroidota bacterium]
MNRFICCAAFCLFSFLMTAQIIGINSKPIDDQRYKDIKGSPYLFDDWQAATVYKENGDVIENAMVNYNAYEKTIEAKVKNGYVELSGDTYPKILLVKDSSYFAYNFHPKFKTQFARIHFVGEDYQFFSTTTSRINKRTINNVGKTITLENFANVTTYYLLQGEQLQPIKLKKKDLLALFPDKANVKFVKQEQLKLNTAEEVVRFLEFAEN